MYAYVHQVYLKLLVLALLTNIGHLARGQYSLEGFSIGDSSIQWFDEQIGLQAHELFTGVYEPLEDRTGLYHPFWASRSWAIGEIFYRGEHFQGIYLLYDLEKDQVLTRNHEGKYLNEAIRLNQEQIDWFRLGGAHFENKEADTVFSAGFYEVLYRDGTFEMLSKRQKEREYQVNEILILPNDSFYLFYAGAWHKVNRPSGLYKLLPEVKRQLKPCIRDRRIRKFQDASSKDLKALAAYCANLLSNE